MRRAALVVALSTVAACSSGKAALDDDFSGIGKADVFSTQLGGDPSQLELIQPGMPKTVAYSNPPKYRALRYQAAAGQSLDVWVRAPGQSDEDADPVAWLLNDRFEVVTNNDDAVTGSDASSHMTASGVQAGTYYIVFREFSRRPATFQVSLDLIGSNGSDGGTEPDGGADPKAHPPLEQLVNFTNGPVLSSMELYTVVWSDHPELAADANAFNAWMLKSSYWSTLAQYGVGPGTAKGVITLPGPAPATLSNRELEQNIPQWIASGVLPKPDSQTTFAFLVPPTTKTTLDLPSSCGATASSEGCQYFGGYHASAVNAATNTAVPYIVALQCSPGLDALTVVLSHEAAEAATDPFSSMAAFASATSGSEVADLCTGHPLDVEGHHVERLYSNALAAKGDTNPCAPSSPTDGPFEGIALDPPQIVIQIDANGNGVGSVNLVPFTYGQPSPFSWTADVEPLPMCGGAAAPMIRFTPGASGSATPGHPVSLQINVEGAHLTQAVATTVNLFFYHQDPSTYSLVSGVIELLPQATPPSSMASRQLPRTGAERLAPGLLKY